MAEKASIILAAEDRTRQAFAQVQANLQGLNSGANLVRSSFAGIAGALSLGLAGAKFSEIVNGLDALNDAADATGSSIENLSALEDISARTGTRFDTVTGALVKFNQTLNAAEPDSGISKALKRIALDADELRKLDPSAALLKTAQALEVYANDGDKARLVQELFGKSIREVAPLLKDLAEKGQLNATVTKEQAEQAESFNKQLSALSKNATDAGRAIAADLLPLLNQVFERARGITAGGGFFASIGKEIKANLLSEELKTSVRSLELIQQKIDFGATGVELAGLERRKGLIRTDVEELQRRLSRASDDLRGFADRASPIVVPTGSSVANFDTRRFPEAPKRKLGDVAGAGGRGNKRAGIKPDLPFVGPEEFEPLRAALRRLEQTDTAKIAALRAELDQLLSIGGAAPTGKVADAIRQVSDALEQADPVGPGLPASLKAAFEAIDQTDTRKAAALTEQLQELLSIQAGSDGTAVAEAIAKIRGEIDALDPDKVRLADLLGATDSAQLEKTRADMLLLADALQRVEISAEQYSEAVNKRLGLDLPANLQKTRGIAEELGLTFSSAFEDAIVSGGNFSDVLKGLEKDLLRLLARKLIFEPAAEKISGLFGSAGAIGSLVKLFTASAKGNVFSGAPGLSAFSNSIVNQPTVFPFARGVGLMGEAGPEAILPLKRTRGGELGVVQAAAASPAAGTLALTIVNQGTPQEVVSTRRLSDGEIVMMFRDARAGAVKDVALQFKDANSDVSKGFAQGLKAERKR